MIPVTQTKLYRSEDHPEGRQRGNCQRAAMASILEIGIDDMPPFELAATSSDFWEDIRIWLEERGLRLAMYDEEDPPKGYALAYGPAPRGVRHAVVVLDGALAWDPHPSRDGLISIDIFEAMVPMTEAEKEQAEIRAKMRALRVA